MCCAVRQRRRGRQLGTLARWRRGARDRDRRHGRCRCWCRRRRGCRCRSVGTFFVLRHRSLDMTAYYAKVDIALLKQVTRPWPRVRS
ncbi:MAG: hypothetical protein DMF95_18920 [Acidobacteria bacterium]|nr:MAG: hypothetical protein DMF94_32750 [Acidobacteriota bacterium]PYR46166.1 MAG: hypothetical protein DMF95_18920 [Acidobacteriota bacterium]